MAKIGKIFYGTVLLLGSAVIAWVGIGEIADVVKEGKEEKMKG